MSALRESDKVRSSADLQEVIGTPIADLSGAIEDLRGACTRLQTSIRGVNSDLEETNKRLSAALDIQAETSTYLESIFASIPSGVIVVDAQGHIVLFNTAAEAITGFRSDEVKGRSYSKTVGKMVSQKQTPLYTLATGSSIDLQEKTLRTKAGESIAVSFSTSLLLDRNNGMKGAVEVITDLRRTKMLEEEVARARTLATIGEIAAVVAHEIRNPLGGIKGFASLLERDLRENPQGLSILRRISEGIEALETITGDLLEAGRHTKLKFTHTELGAEILNLVEMYEMAAKGEGKAISFEVTKPDGPLYCRVDRDRIRQALSNLLRNATEAVEAGGVVKVHLYGRDRGDRRRLDDQEDGGGTPSGGARSVRAYVCIEVMDTGPGISKDVLDKIFSPFFTTKRDGTGLGLSTVKRIAALHGGTVTYSKAETGGSAFIIEIPRW